MLTPSMRFLVRMSSKDSNRERFLAAARSLARSVGAEPRNPKWTSRGALELDLFAPTKGDFELFLSAARPLYVIEFFRDLNEAPPYKPEEELFAEAREYFNAERYWECHEVLEGVWRTKSGEEKNFLQGLILVCAAFVHHQKGEEEVAYSVLSRALRQLSYPNGPYGGFDPGEVRQKAQAILDSHRFVEFQV
jgi:predicted metal-dependent hydrolase